MTTYKELQAQIEKLQKQAEEVRKSELASAIADIKAKMQEYGITPADLDFTGKKKAVKTRQPVEAKYRNDATGETWSGRGMAPKWIVDQDREKFLIK
jgi:DNA-binding protein H-NS